MSLLAALDFSLFGTLVLGAVVGPLIAAAVRDGREAAEAAEAA